jgi:hypothetical protein
MTKQTKTNEKASASQNRETYLRKDGNVAGYSAKASAPETRVADLKGHINYDEKAGCWMIGDTPIDSTERTLPAEKPTEDHESLPPFFAQQRNYSDAMVEDLAATHAKLLVHAEALAEALREMALVTVWGKSSPVLAKAREALAAWEGVK